jgi:DNA polymerase elongation subunit (family B)
VKSQIAEEAGFEMLHALTDSLWLKKSGLTEEDAHSH